MAWFKNQITCCKIHEKMRKNIVNFNLIVFFSTFLLGTGCAKHAEDKPISDPVDWKVIGPGGGGGVLKPTVSPFNANFVLTHCDMTGMYISTNGGESWKMKNLWNVPDDFEFDPSDSNTLYVATRGFLHSEDRGSGISLLLRSDDRGSTWRIIFPDAGKSKKVERLQSTSLKPSEIIDGALDGTVQKVRVDPADHNRIFLGLAPLIDYMGPGGSKDMADVARLLVSEDHGLTWKVIAELPGENVLGIFPYGKGNEVIIFTEHACVSVNEGTGKAISLPLPVNSISVAEGGKSPDGTLIYIQSDFKRNRGEITGGIFVTRDLGETWSQINEGLLSGTARGMVPYLRQGLAVCESQPEVAYVSVINPVTNEKGQIDAIYSIYKTTNGGRQWVPVLLSSTPGGYLTHNFSGSWMEKSYDPGWGGSPIDLGVAPRNPDVCYAGDNGRGYKTTDGGKTWVQVYSHNNPDGSYTNNGLNVTTCYGVHFDPFNKDHFFICYTDIGLFHTFDGGRSWFHAISDVPRDWQNTCYDVAFDPAVNGKVWSVWADAHDLPRTKMFGGRGFSEFHGGVAVSADGGRTWRKSNTGLPENSVCTNILIDSSSAVESRTMFVSVFDRGIYRSTDGGANWKQTINGLGDNLFAWQVRQNSNGRLFALFARGQRNGKTVDGEIFFSDDKASNWKKMLLPVGINGPHDLLIDPVHPAIMYVSCWPHTTGDKDTGGGIIKTSDGGITWKQTFDDRVRVNSAGIDPRRTGTIFINTFQNAAYRSDDSGNSWKRIDGYRFKWGQRAVPDINHPGMLFLTTYGGSVFYGPAAGVSGAADDIINMPEGWW
jgi:photosystem II stability/assembly factor-like uncharacterized protein